MKLAAHCEPLLLGPAFAIDTVKGRSCLRLRLNSSSNSPPQMLWPPVPSPAGCTDSHSVASILGPALYALRVLRQTYTLLCEEAHSRSGEPSCGYGNGCGCVIAAPVHAAIAPVWKRLQLSRRDSCHSGQGGRYQDMGRTQGVASLHHEALDDSVEDDAVIVAILCMR